jgi:hypothetical protein
MDNYYFHGESISWEADSRSASLEIHYLFGIWMFIHNAPFNPLRSQFNPVHIPFRYLGCDKDFGRVWGPL